MASLFLKDPVLIADIPRWETMLLAEKIAARSNALLLEDIKARNCEIIHPSSKGRAKRDSSLIPVYEEVDVSNVSLPLDVFYVGKSVQGLPNQTVRAKHTSDTHVYYSQGFSNSESATKAAKVLREKHFDDIEEWEHVLVKSNERKKKALENLVQIAI